MIEMPIKIKVARTAIPITTTKEILSIFFAAFCWQSIIVSYVGMK
jgi:hypothetical protein